MAWLLQDLVQFRGTGGGINVPSVCLSPNEKFLYLLGYPYISATPNVPTLALLQYPIDLSNPNVSLPLSAADTILNTSDPYTRRPSASVPYSSQNTDIRLGPDNKIYMFFQTGQSFLGVVNQPDNAGTACNFNVQGVQLLPNTYGSYYFPAIENKVFQTTIQTSRQDTLLCFSELLP